MKKSLLYLLIGELFVFGITACNIDELAFRPTYAIPVVEAKMTIGEILNSRPSEVETTFNQAFGTDSLFNFQLVYTDTLDPLTFESFGGAGNTVPAGSYPNLFMSRNVFLRMTGSSRKHLGTTVPTQAVPESFSAKRENFQKVAVSTSK